MTSRRVRRVTGHIAFDAGRGGWVTMNDELRAELMERADRDQAARKPLPSGHEMRQWEEEQRA
jgi:hypothetical protein